MARASALFGSLWHGGRAGWSILVLRQTAEGEMRDGGQPNAALGFSI